MSDNPKEVKAEEKSICAKCGKKLKRKSWYYRNNKFYCNKRCWRQIESKTEPKPEAKPKPEPKPKAKK